MKKLAVLLGLALTIITQAQTTPLTAVIDKYAGMEGYTYVYITEYMFQLAATIAEEDDPEAKELMNNLKTLVVLTANAETNANRTVRFADEVKNALPKGNYKVLLKVVDGTENVDILANEQNGIINELILTVKSPDEDLLLILTGQINLKSIAKLSHSMNIDEMKHLEKINESKTN
jgi:hypothetical protein